MAYDLTEPLYHRKGGVTPPLLQTKMLFRPVAIAAESYSGLMCVDMALITLKCFIIMPGAMAEVFDRCIMNRPLSSLMMTSTACAYRRLLGMTSGAGLDISSGGVGMPEWWQSPAGLNMIQRHGLLLLMTRCTECLSIVTGLTLVLFSLGIFAMIPAII